MATPRKPKELHLPEGAPELYRADFHPKDFIRLSKQGKNITQISSKWDISRTTVYEWADKYPQFSNAIIEGKAHCEAWYTEVGQMAMLNQAQIGGQKTKVELGFFVWMTKNVCKWSDKTEDLTPVSKKKLELSAPDKKKVKAVLEKVRKDC